ncbi:MAG: tetratricopeptide repeat protein [Chloroflexi bacterium]|nr:tetratricopeptide repeat protein [Chloroflexota bacterium]
MVKRRTPLDPSSFQTFGELLRYLRERASLSQRALAQQVGYHYSYMSRLEKNVRTPDTLILRTRFLPALRIGNDSAWATRLLELAIEGPQEDLAPKTESVARPRPGANLPVSLTPLLGRESESAALFQILTSADVRLVTLIGPPGVGKTRLSLHLAEQLALHFADGVVFVDLMPILDPAQVIPELAAALGAQETYETSMAASVQSALHGREMLIVMDNFEQVLEAAPQLIPLLGAAPGVKILATSREALRLRGEQEFPLAPLPVPDDAGSVLDFPSVQLFVQRARAAKPDFQLNEADAARVTEICRRLDGLPLAIELAAARVRSFSPADMLEQFDRRFQWLANTGRDIPEWRRTLWSAIAWSYNLLTDKERTLFARLSVFAGGWTVEAAEAVCCDERVCPRNEMMSMLMQLVDRSLVVAEGTRYHFLDTIARFAHEKLIESGDLEERSARHLQYFAEWAESLETQFNAIPPAVFQERTGVELNNIRAALEWALRHKEAFEDGLRLSIPANLIFLEHGLIRDEYDRAHVFLRRAAVPSLKARLLLRTAALGLRLGQDSLAHEYCLKTEGMARELNDKRLLADSLHMFGDIDRDRNQFDAAEKALTECVSIYRELNLLPELNRSLTSLGNNSYYQGRREESSALLDEALEIATRIEDGTGLGAALRARAGHLRFEGRLEEAFEAFKRVLDVARANSDRPNAGIALVNLSIITNLFEDYPASEKYASEAIAMFQSVGDENQQAFPKRMQAYALLHQGFPTRAHALALESLASNLNGGTGVLNCLTALAEIKLAEGGLESVARLYGFLAPRVRERYAEASPDARSYERLGRALQGHVIEAWQAEGGRMTLEEAVTLASRWNLPRTGVPKPRPTPKSKRSRR